jgi:hypothetical protein
MGEIPELIGIFIRWIFVFKCNRKRMNEIHNDNYDKERHSDFLVGLLFILFLLGIIILWQLYY